MNDESSGGAELSSPFSVLERLLRISYRHPMASTTGTTNRQKHQKEPRSSLTRPGFTPVHATKG